VLGQRRRRQQAALQRLRQAADGGGGLAFGAQRPDPVQRLRGGGGEGVEEVVVLGGEHAFPAPGETEGADDAVGQAQRPGGTGAGVGVTDDRCPAEGSRERGGRRVLDVTQDLQAAVLEDPEHDAVGLEQADRAAAEDLQDVVLVLGVGHGLGDGDETGQAPGLPLLQVGAATFGLVGRGGGQGVADGGGDEAQEVPVGGVERDVVAEHGRQDPLGLATEGRRDADPGESGRTRLVLHEDLAGAQHGGRGRQRRLVAGQLEVDGPQVRGQRRQHVQGALRQLERRLQLGGEVAEAAEEFEATVVLHLAGGLRRDVHHPGDGPAVVADRGVGEREERLLQEPAAVHHHRHVGVPDGVPGHRPGEEGFQLRPGLGEDLTDGTSQGGVLAADHVGVGLVVEHREVGTPDDEDREPGLEGQFEGSAEGAGPVVRRPQGRRGPVDGLVGRPQVCRGPEGQTEHHPYNVMVI
jgi:hypothetical protein